LIFKQKHAIDFWISKGADPAKLILGMGTYGRGWLLDDQSVSGFYAPAAQLIPAGPFTREPGILGYNEVQILPILNYEQFRGVGHKTIIIDHYESYPFPDC
jgi:GH18 family chitinase